MSSYVWSDVRSRAIAAFEEFPHGSTEDRIIAVFEREPTLVMRTIEVMAERKRAGTVKSAWAVLRTELDRLESVQDVVATDEGQRTRAVARAEEWVRHAGVHYDREDEILEELFGDHGRLRSLASDERTRERMVALWRKVRPQGEQADRDELERAERWTQTTGLEWRLKRDPKFAARWAAEQEARQPVAIAAAPADPDDEFPF